MGLSSSLSKEGQDSPAASQGQCNSTAGRRRTSQRSSLPVSSLNNSPQQLFNPSIRSRAYTGRSWSFADDTVLDLVEAAPQPEEELLTSGPLTLTTRLEYTSLRKGESYNVFGLVSLQAAEEDGEPRGPAAPAEGESRAPVDVTCVLDVSGSMQGEKIQLVREAMLFVVSELNADDRLSIVTFNHSANRSTRLARMNETGQDEARQAIMRLQAGGGTSIAAGLDCGIAVLEQRRQRNPVGAVFLLTDGQDSSAQHSVQPLVDRARAAQCSVYAFGFGADHDTSVMSAISETAQTPFTFVERLESVKDAFAGAVGGLMSVAAQNIEVSIVPECGCTLTAVHTHFASRREAGEGSTAVVTIPDAFAGERRDVVVELQVSANADAADGQAPVMRASAKYRSLRDRATVLTPQVFLSVQRTNEPEDEPDVEVVAQRQRVQVTDALERAIKHGEEGNFDRAQQVLQEQEEALKGTRVATEVSKALLAEVEDARVRTSSSSQWQQGGKAEMTDAMWMHRTQRCTNDCEGASSLSHKKSSKSLYLSTKQRSSISKMKG